MKLTRGFMDFYLHLLIKKKKTLIDEFDRTSLLL